MAGHIASIRVAEALLSRILEDARTGPDGAPAGVERCGLLLGDALAVTGFVPAANVHPDAARHFELDPAALLATTRAARAGGQAIIGHYHLHPAGGPAEPSAEDAANADADARLWLVVTPDDAALWQAVAGGPHRGAFAPVILLAR